MEREMAGTSKPEDPKPDDPELPAPLPIHCRSLILFQRMAPHQTMASLRQTMCPSCRLQVFNEGSVLPCLISPTLTHRSRIFLHLLCLIFPTPIPEVRLTPGEGPDLPPEPSELPGDDVPKVG